VKSILVNSSDYLGGAAIAAYRTHQALRHVGVDSTMWVNRKISDDWTVKAKNSAIHRILTPLRKTIGRAIPELLFRDVSKTYRSYNWLPSSWSSKLNDADVDLVHLVWVNGEMVSISDIQRINKPKIMTLQDMWPFCGAEHYSKNDRYKTGYSKGSAVPTTSGVDVDRWVWNRKRRAWTEPFQLVAISEWLAACIRDSALLSGWPVEVIPNPVDTSVWKPLDRQVARRAFNLPENKKIVLFGALGGTSDERKGYAYLEQALIGIAEVRDDVHLVIYGQGKPENPPQSPFPISYVGRLSDPVTMCLLNNSADIFVNPAIQEAFGQTASEAQACGVPVVAFADTGIADIVEHKVTGYLAPLADAQQLAEGVLWVLDREGDSSSSNSAAEMRNNCRSRAVSKLSYEVVGKRYQELYASVVASKST